MLKFKSNSDKETVSFGKRFAKVLGEKDLVVLEGALGGGKTTFIKGVLLGLDYGRRVLSPSFTLVRQYKTKKFLVHHMDLYRLQADDIFDLGSQEMFYSAGSITLIEWGAKIEPDLDKYIKIRFSFKSLTKREFTFSVKGYDFDNSVLGRTLGYQQWKDYFDGEKNKNDILQKWKYDEHAYARRQMTWFKKDKKIIWFDIDQKGWETKVADQVFFWYTKKNAKEN